MKQEKHSYTAGWSINCLKHTGKPSGIPWYSWRRECPVIEEFYTKVSFLENLHKCPRKHEQDYDCSIVCNSKNGNNANLSTLEWVNKS